MILPKESAEAKGSFWKYIARPSLSSSRAGNSFRSTKPHLIININIAQSTGYNSKIVTSPKIAHSVWISSNFWLKFLQEFYWTLYLKVWVKKSWNEQNKSWLYCIFYFIWLDKCFEREFKFAKFEWWCCLTLTKFVYFTERADLFFQKGFKLPTIDIIIYLRRRNLF